MNEDILIGQNHWSTVFSWQALIHQAESTATLWKAMLLFVDCIVPSRWLVTAKLAKLAGPAHFANQCWINPKGHSSYSCRGIGIISWDSIASASLVHPQYCFPGDIALPILPTRRHFFPKFILVNQCCLPGNNGCAALPCLISGFGPKIYPAMLPCPKGVAKIQWSFSSGEQKPIFSNVARGKYWLRKTTW